MSETVLYSDIIKGSGPKLRPAGMEIDKKNVEIQQVSSADLCSHFGSMFLSLFFVWDLFVLG